MAVSKIENMRFLQSSLQLILQTSERPLSTPVIDPPPHTAHKNLTKFLGNNFPPKAYHLHS